MTSHIGSLIRDWRMERKLSLGALSLKADVHKATLSRWERQEQQPRVSELEAVLTALQVTDTQRREALALLDAPRAVIQLRNLTGAGLALSPPTAGDLLRAIRLRRGLTLEQAAAQTGIAFSLIARYERGEQWPEFARLHDLCFALRALPEEVSALTCGGGSWLSEMDAEASESNVGPEEWEARIERTWGRVNGLEDLRMFSLEAQLWRLANRRPDVLPVLQSAYAHHARLLMQTMRTTEALPFAQRSLALANEGHRYLHEWACSVIAVATAAALERQAPGRARGGTASAGLCAGG